MNIKITRGADIKLEGSAQNTANELHCDTVALKPTDFINMIPKTLVKVGEEVKAGTPIFFNKNNDLVKICSPVSGEVAEIKRGDKRKLLEIIILKDKTTSFIDFGVSTPSSLSNSEVREKMLKSGVWSFLRQRPYDTVANPIQTPKAIFISGFDSNPLAPDYNVSLDGEKENIQAAIDALKKLTPGKVHITTHVDKTVEALSNLTGVESHTISGPHPSGNVGVQIHHIDPINRGEKIWYLNALHLPIIGKLFTKGVYDASIKIAATGSELSKTGYYTTVIGANIKNVFANNLKTDNNRFISGNPFTGSTISSEGYVGFFDTQLTVIQEGDYSEFFGWLSFSPKKLSLSRAFTSWLTSGKEFKVDTNNHGEDRAFVVTGQYEQYIPMDIYPMQLLKSIMTGDIEQMEQLGIYEVSPEDFALAEFSCTSKQLLQKTVQEGIDIMIKEVG